MTVPHSQEDLRSTETIPSAPVAQSIEERPTQTVPSDAAPNCCETVPSDSAPVAPMTQDDESKKTYEDSCCYKCCGMCCGMCCECLTMIFG
mmetsp:Transcript_19817/g.35860  ORF Transcript_19817/g.35860 Transcript_19817/m.35860 type:complete len:91 (-) Transcript_19817:140-412(-)